MVPKRDATPRHVWYHMGHNGEVTSKHVWYHMGP